MKKHHFGIALGAVAVIAAMVFLYFRLNEQGFRWSKFVEVLQGLDRRWLFAALPLILLAYVVRAARWLILVRPLAPQATLWQMTVATFIGFTAVVLFGRAGEPVRPLYIARKLGIPFSSQVAAWLTERILDLLMILAMFGFALSQTTDVGWAPDSKLHAALRVAGLLAGISGAGCLAALVALRRFRGQIRSRLEEALAFLPERPLQRVLGFIQAFDEGMQSTRDPATVWTLVFSTVVEWTLLACVYMATLRAFPDLAPLPPIEVLTVMGFVTFAGVVQLPGIGGGMQIATVLVLTEMYGIRVEVASAAALIVWAINFLSALPLGLGMAFHEGIRWRTMREMEKEAQL